MKNIFDWIAVSVAVLLCVLVAGVVIAILPSVFNYCYKKTIDNKTATVSDTTTFNAHALASIEILPDTSLYGIMSSKFITGKTCKFRSYSFWDSGFGSPNVELDRYYDTVWVDTTRIKLIIIGGVK